MQKHCEALSFDALSYHNRIEGGAREFTLSMICYPGELSMMLVVFPLQFLFEPQYMYFHPIRTFPTIFIIFLNAKTSIPSSPIVFPAYFIWQHDAGSKICALPRYGIIVLVNGRKCHRLSLSQIHQQKLNSLISKRLLSNDLSQVLVSVSTVGSRPPKPPVSLCCTFFIENLASSFMNAKFYSFNDSLAKNSRDPIF